MASSARRCSAASSARSRASRASDAGSETPKSPNSGCDPQAQTDTDRCRSAWPLGSNAGCCGVPIALKGVPRLEPVDEEVNLPKRGAGVGINEDGAHVGLEVFSSSDKGELLYLIRCDRANRGGRSLGAKDGRSEGMSDDPRPFNAAARSDEPRRDESRRRRADASESRSLNPTEKRPEARTVDASESRGGRRVCALSKDSLHGPAGGRPVLSHDRARWSSPRPGVAKKTVRASGAAESIDKALCGGECGVSLPKLDDDERRRPPILSTSESHRASGPALREGGGGGGGLSAIMLRIGRPSVDDVDDVLATIDGRSSRSSSDDLPSVSSSSSSRAAVPSRPARSRRATSGGAWYGMPPTPARPSPDVATMDRNPKRSHKAAILAFLLLDHPGSALTTRPESGPAPSASACRNAFRSHRRSAGRALRSVLAAPSGDASGLSSE